MKFTKMQGIGNDYVYVNCFEENIGDRGALAARVSDRHFGVGSDGLICICPSEIADFKMDMYNADGSSGGMCGNGMRCVAKYVHDRGMTDKTEFTVESDGKIKTVKLEVESGVTTRITVDMGEPALKPEEIPVKLSGERIVNQSVTVLGGVWNITCVNMGNPHAVTFMDDISNFDIERIGSAFEHNELFPERTNTEFVRVIDRQTLQMRVWERGAGETLACGTGACAVLVAGVLNGLCERKAVIKLSGGDLEIEWREENGHIYMTGPAEFVFDGTI